MRGGLLPLLALLAACGGTEPAEPTAAATAPDFTEAATPSPAPTPDLALCERYAPADDGERQRTKRLPVPAALAGVLASDSDHYAVLTEAGTTRCLDTRWMDEVDDVALSRDGRFLEFGWTGYEAYGHQLVDRKGGGAAVETGVKPVFSPSGQRFAAIEVSESGFGGLNAFAVWRVGPDRVIELGKVEAIPEGYADWRIDRWAGETCLELSAVANADVPGDYGKIGTAPRQHFVAKGPGGQWEIRGEPERCAKG